MPEPDGRHAGVARYYDRNTRRFLLVGGGRGSHSIHRELWGPGVSSARDAVRHIDRLIADEIGALAAQPPPALVDFGCGVGGTLLQLAERFPDARLHGVTISAVQVESAKQLARRAGVADRCTFTHGDYCAVDLGVRATAVVAIESMAHGADIDAFLGNAARHLGPRGALIVVDDFLAAPLSSLGEAGRRRVDQLRAGWQLHGLCTAEHVVAEAARHRLSLRKDLDLSGYTRPGSRVRDHLVALASPVLDRLGLSRVPFFGNMIGGNALQIGLENGYIRYKMLVFEAAAGSEAEAAPG
ncbi:MAG: methyltransferase domain-containing protein [Gemmatimonadetes bacterium]|nr:methyltransferase domain-containing protein [Gemmatimonadota bacterium]MDA1103963.1 methyltransferase domain-containing protein [Gemmatimonadota bacterium]